MKVKVAVSHWTQKMNYEGVLKLLIHSGKGHHLSQITFAYMAQWFVLLPVSERSRDLPQARASSSFPFLSFPYFLTYSSKAYVSSLFIQNVTYLWAEIHIWEASYQSIESVFHFVYLKKGEVSIIPEYSSLIWCFFRKWMFKLQINKV